MYINSHRIKWIKSKENLFEIYGENDYEKAYITENVLDNFDVNFIPEENIIINSNYDYLLIYIYQYTPYDFFIDIKKHYEIKISKRIIYNRNNDSFSIYINIHAIMTII